jgi:quercetin dioxygenase-like cupin family protein
MPTGNEGRVLLVPPGGGEEHWQPQPANGWISILAAPEVANAPRGVSVGLQELPPLGKIREHAHPAQDEYFYFLEGEGLARLDGVVRRIRRGSFLFAGAHARHGFINDGDVPFRFLWLLAPAGLEAFFRAIGRPRTADGPDPTPYARPADISATELATVFETLDPPPPPPWDSLPITDPAVLVPLRRAAV